jgi:hypothetical protein
MLFRTAYVDDPWVQELFWMSERGGAVVCTGFVVAA